MCSALLAKPQLSSRDSRSLAVVFTQAKRRCGGTSHGKGVEADEGSSHRVRRISVFVFLLLRARVFRNAIPQEPRGDGGLVLRMLARIEGGRAVTLIWFIVWFIANIVGDNESLTIDPVNWWTGTLMLAVALDLSRQHAPQLGRTSRGE
jgi:hypothetical protein